MNSINVIHVLNSLTTPDLQYIFSISPSLYYLYGRLYQYQIDSKSNTGNQILSDKIHAEAEQLQKQIDVRQNVELHDYTIYFKDNPLGLIKTNLSNYMSVNSLPKYGISTIATFDIVFKYWFLYIVSNKLLKTNLIKIDDTLRAVFPSLENQEYIIFTSLSPLLEQYFTPLSAGNVTITIDNNQRLKIWNYLQQINAKLSNFGF